jgi:hypothetical protein
MYCLTLAKIPPDADLVCSAIATQINTVAGLLFGLVE